MRARGVTGKITAESVANVVIARVPDAPVAAAASAGRALRVPLAWLFREVFAGVVMSKPAAEGAGASVAPARAVIPKAAKRAKAATVKPAAVAPKAATPVPKPPSPAAADAAKSAAKTAQKVAAPVELAAKSGDGEDEDEEVGGTDEIQADADSSVADEDGEHVLTPEPNGIVSDGELSNDDSEEY